MADIRIKDLTTLASASLTGDVFVIDGTTGARKLSAFSPTFGGNATVTGTLTVNGTGTNSIPNLSVTGIGGLNVSANFLTSANTLRFSDSAAGGQTWFMSPQLGDGVATNFAFYSNDGVTSTPLFRVSSAGVFRLPSTAASTTTSSGALVVGNGTSGGLGVGGALNVGGQIRAQLGLFAGSPPTGLASAYQVDVDAGTSRDILSWGDSSRVGLIRGEQDGSGRATLKFGRYTASTFAEYFRVTGLAATDAIVNIYGTTASTSTSTGALVVSGGVGVGGAVNIGGTLSVLDGGTASSAGTIRLSNNTSIGWRNAANSADIFLTVNNSNIFSFGSGAPVYVNNSTASTSTSSGALVVSGGVGVAGAINAGDQIKSERTSGTDTASAVLGVLTTTGAGVTNSFGIDARVIVNNSSGTTVSATGLRALSRVSNVSTVTQAVAMLAQVDNPGGGTITTAYGLYVNPITAGGTNYAIYTGGGRINFQSLPTSSAGLAAGTIWNDAGTLKVA